MAKAKKKRMRVYIKKEHIVKAVSAFKKYLAKPDTVEFDCCKECLLAIALQDAFKDPDIEIGYRTITKYNSKNRTDIPIADLDDKGCEQINLFDSAQFDKLKPMQISVILR